MIGYLKNGVFLTPVQWTRFI